MTLSYHYRTFRLPLWLLRLIKRHTVYVRAAGGIVTAPDGDMLLILRNGRWDLAKGKVEPGETLLQAALREVEEETGVQNLKPLPPSHSATLPPSHSATLPPSHSATKPLSHSATQPPSHSATQPLKTYHLFRAPRAWYAGPNPPAHRWHLKQTSWFPMTAEKQPVTPQQEEGITAGEWVDPHTWHSRLQSSYGTLRTLSSQYQKRHNS